MDRRAALAAEIERTIEADLLDLPDFDYGVRDCLLWGADIVQRAIGVDPAEPYRGRYDDEAGAAAVIGPKGLLWTSRCRALAIGAKRVKIAEAQIGDWAVASTKLGLASVLKYRGPFWVGVIDRGHVYLRDENVKAAWRFC